MSKANAIAVNRAVDADIAGRKRAVDRLKAARDIAVEALVQIAQSGEKDADRLRAAVEILDRTGVTAEKAAPQTNVNINVSAEQLAAFTALAVQDGHADNTKPLKTLELSAEPAKLPIKHDTLEALTAAADSGAEAPETPPSAT